MPSGKHCWSNAICHWKHAVKGEEGYGDTGNIIIEMLDYIKYS